MLYYIIKYTKINDCRCEQSISIMRESRESRQITIDTCRATKSCFDRLNVMTVIRQV